MILLVHKLRPKMWKETSLQKSRRPLKISHGMGMPSFHWAHSSSNHQQMRQKWWKWKPWKWSRQRWRERFNGNCFVFGPTKRRGISIQQIQHLLDFVRFMVQSWAAIHMAEPRNSTRDTKFISIGPRTGTSEACFHWIDWKTWSMVFGKGWKMHQKASHEKQKQHTLTIPS